MNRRRIVELMDDPAVDQHAHAHALKSLNRVNRWLGVDRCMAQCIGRIGGGGGVSVLDLGVGGGGFLAYLSEHVHCVETRIGLDRSVFALICAEAWCRHALRGVVGDARQLPLADDSIDVVTCSLFLHHFDPPDVVTILGEAARVSRQGIVLSDLSRSWIAWGATNLATRLLSRSRIFHVDGSRSVRAAFRMDELGDLARRAGLRGASIERCWPFRLMLTWRKGHIGKSGGN